MSVHISIKTATKFLDYDGTIGYLGSVKFNERQLALGRAELQLVVHILKSYAKINNYFSSLKNKIVSKGEFSSVENGRQ